MDEFDGARVAGRGGSTAGATGGSGKDAGGGDVAGGGRLEGGGGGKASYEREREESFFCSIWFPSNR